MKQMREFLRKAGKSILDADERYAKRAARDMGGAHQSPVKVFLGATPARELVMKPAKRKGLKSI